MNNKGLVITTIIFFLLINTMYYWEGKLDLWAIPVFLLLAFVYALLGFALLRQIFFSVREKFVNKQRLYRTGFLIIVLGLILYKPYGLINFDKLEGKDMLVAGGEGAANCSTIFKLKDDFTFREWVGCFGVTETRGRYYLQNDTIFFTNQRSSRPGDQLYQFAVILPSIWGSSKIVADLVRYKDMSDTSGHILGITKNELTQLMKIQAKNDPLN